MEIFPAIDIRGGKVVRLTQGDYDRMEVYGDDPAAVAADFASRGARNLHLVDLDGARDGEPANREVIRRVAEGCGLFTQVGGGIRDEERIEDYLAQGVGRVILGTIAAEDFAFLERMVARYGERIAVGVDARDGKVAVRGWRKTMDLHAAEFCKRLENAGVRTVIYTDIARDGMGIGSNLEAYRSLEEAVACDIVASGGISSTGELEALRDMGVHGAIVGKALYNGALRLEEALALC